MRYGSNEWSREELVDINGREKDAEEWRKRTDKENLRDFLMESGKELAWPFLLLF